MKNEHVKEKKIQIHNLTSIMIFFHLTEYLIGNINVNKIEIWLCKIPYFTKCNLIFPLKNTKEEHNY